MGYLASWVSMINSWYNTLNLEVNMFFVKFANGNINVHADGDKWDKVEDFISDLANSIELDFIEVMNEGAPEYRGNDYADYAVNIGWYEYHVSDFMVRRLNDGYVVKLEKWGDVARLTVPRFYDSYKFNLDGVNGTLYKLCDKLSRNDAAILEAVPGVRVLTVQTQYAPEIKHAALFVPRGIVRNLC